MSKKLIITLVVSGVIITFLAGAYFIMSPERRMFTLYKISPNLFKKAAFHKLQQGDQEVYMLGTTHRHLASDDYSLLHIRSVIENLKPDLLLVESRPSEIKAGNLADGPFEMLYAHLIARSQGIEVKGVDWWTPESGKPGTTCKERDDKIVKNILNSVNGYNKVLVLLGFTHILEDIPRLEAAGYQEVKFTGKEKTELFTTGDRNFTFPEGMIDYLEKRLQRQKSLIGEVYTTDEWIKAIKNNNRNLEKLIKHIEEKKGV